MGKIFLTVHILLLLVSVSLAEMPSSSAPDKKVWVLDVERVPGEELLVASVVQGLANRTAPRVFLQTGSANWVATFKNPGIHHSDETLKKYRGADDVYMEYYAKYHGFQFEPVADLEALLKKAAPSIQGAVMYDSKSPFEWVIASAFASARDLVPVTKKLCKAYPALAALPVKENLAGKFTDVVEAHRWAYEQLGRDCSRKAAYSAGGGTHRFSMDIAVAQKMFVYVLGSLKTKTPKEAEMIDMILSKLEPCSPIYGWGMPYESALRDRASLSGHFVMCSENPNISFHAQVKPLQSGPLQRKYPAVEPGKVKLEDKYYVAFMVNEGDTLKAQASLMCYGMWLEPQRGQVPINWGVCPWICENYPALMAYYYTQMSPLDSFFTATTGYGYFTPGMVPNLAEFAKLEVRGNQFANVSVGASWGSPGMSKANRYAWFDQRQLLGCIMEDGKTSYLDFTPKNTPVVSLDWTLFYPKARFKDKSEDEINVLTAERIQQVAAQHEPPYFIPVYGGNPRKFFEIAKNLPADKFKIVSLEEMMSAARLAGRVQADRDRVELDKDENKAGVRITVRNMDAAPRSGSLAVEAPNGWAVAPVSWAYPALEAKTGSAKQTFQITLPPGVPAGPYKLSFKDSASGAVETVLVAKTDRVSTMTAANSAARVVKAPKVIIKMDGSGAGWEKVKDSLDQDLRKMPKREGNLHAKYRFAWDANYLYVLVQEQRDVKQAVESMSAAEFRKAGGWQADAVGFHMDFSHEGAKDCGLVLWLGFCSKGQKEAIYGVSLNGETDLSGALKIDMLTRGMPGKRVIEARIPLRELQKALEPRYQPGGDINAALKPGFRFGCQPHLAQSGQAHAFLNNESEMMPSGFDAASVDIELVK